MFPFRRKVLSMDEYASYFNDIDPLSQYKTWGCKKIFSQNSHYTYVRTDKVQAVFIVSDPVDWGRDMQVFSSKLAFLLLSLIKKKELVTHFYFRSNFFHMLLQNHFVHDK